jgi:hypothetical protein
MADREAEFGCEDTGGVGLKTGKYVPLIAAI